jgi:predicted PurR-regulated permease PerM
MASSLPFREPPQLGARGSAGARDSRPLRWLVVLLCVAAAATLQPFWVPIVLAVWMAVIARPLHRIVAKRIHRRRGAAALLTVLLAVTFLVPLLIVTLALSGAALELGQRLLSSKSGADALRLLVSDGTGPSLDLYKLDTQQWLELARRHGASALSLAKTLFGAVTVIVLGAVAFVSVFYTLLLEGPQLHEWLLVHAPLPRGQFHRLTSVFDEVGRGLLVGVGLTALLQGVVATIGYIVCGVPQPLVLGLVTIFASLVPSVGSGLVWAPVSLGLFLVGRPGAAAAMLAIGCVVAVVDNVMHPVLARYGQLRLHGLLLFIAMLGGITVFGAGGLLLGPLFVRLAVEGLAMLREASPASFPEG